MQMFVPLFVSQVRVGVRSYPIGVCHHGTNFSNRRSDENVEGGVLADEIIAALSLGVFPGELLQTAR